MKAGQPNIAIDRHGDGHAQASGLYRPVGVGTAEPPANQRRTDRLTETAPGSGSQLLIGLFRAEHGVAARLLLGVALTCGDGPHCDPEPRRRDARLLLGI
jgi:hypothetical protein